MLHQLLDSSPVETTSPGKKDIPALHKPRGLIAWSENLPAHATRICCSIFVADFLTMLLMNIGRMHTHWLPVLFFGIFGASAVVIYRSNFIPANHTCQISAKQQRSLAIFAVAIALVLAGARFPYLLEGHLHHLVGPVIYDDTWHFQEINSLVHSARYPAFCSLVPSRYFSLYYAPWMMIAATYIAVPIHGFTIKSAFAIGCAIYQILFCLTLLHIGIARARDRKHLYWAIYLVAGWAGVESIFSFIYYLLHNAAWLLIPTASIPFVSFLSGMLWAPHHVSAAIALLLCWHVWDRSTGKNWVIVLGCSVLIAYAFYSSVFVFIGALPIAIFYVLRTVRRNYPAVILCLCVNVCLIWPLLWLYLGKSQDIRFIFPFITGSDTLFPHIAAAQFHAAHPAWSSILGTFPGMTAAMILFILFVACNFLVHTIALAWRGKYLRRGSFCVAIIAALFLFSTFFVGFPEGDNYASRGAIIPIIVLGWICAELLPGIRLKSWIGLCLMLSMFGMVHEGISTYKNTFRIAQTPFNAEIGTSILQMNQDRTTRVVNSSAIVTSLASNPNLIYSIEKLVPGGKSNLVVADRELECLGPHGPWKWQRIPNPEEK